MESFTVILKHHRSHKWSERYDAEDREAPVKSVYILKTAFDFNSGPPPDRIKVTVSEYVG